MSLTRGFCRLYATSVIYICVPPLVAAQRTVQRDARHLEDRHGGLLSTDQPPRQLFSVCAPKHTTHTLFAHAAPGAPWRPFLTSLQACVRYLVRTCSCPMRRPWSSSRACSSVRCP